MRQLVSLLLCIIMLCGVCFADDAASVAEEMGNVIDEYGLTEDNFAVSYRNLSSGETYAYNAQRFFPVGHAWLLPLHMYYCEQTALEKLLPDDPRETEYTVDGLTLDMCRYETILQNNDELAQKMYRALGDFRQYQQLINRAYGHCDENALPDRFYTDTVYSAEFLMNCLQTATQGAELYSDILRNYQLRQPDDGLAAALGGYNFTCIVGEQEGMRCEAAFVSAARPYLLVCFFGEDVSDEAVEAVSRVFLADGERAAPAAQADSRTNDGADLTIATKTRETNQALLRRVAAAVGAAAAVAIVVFVLIKLIRRRRD